MRLWTKDSCLGHLRAWLESQVQLAPRWLITTFSVTPGRYAGSLARSPWRGWGRWTFVELFWGFQCRRKDVGGSESVVLKLGMNLAVKMSDLKNTFDPLDGFLSLAGAWYQRGQSKDSPPSLWSTRFASPASSAKWEGAELDEDFHPVSASDCEFLAASSVVDTLFPGNLTSRLKGFPRSPLDSLPGFESGSLGVNVYTVV